MLEVSIRDALHTLSAIPYSASFSGHVLRVCHTLYLLEIGSIDGVCREL